MANPLARCTRASTMRPRPTIPRRLPVTLRPSGKAPAAQWPARRKRSLSDRRRAVSMISPMARSATQSLSTSGVVLTAMPRCRAAPHGNRVITHAEAADRLEIGQQLELLGRAAEACRGHEQLESPALLAQKGHEIGLLPQRRHPGAAGKGLVEALGHGPICSTWGLCMGFLGWPMSRRELARGAPPPGSPRA